jgi:hypothetical protein
MTTTACVSMNKNVFSGITEGLTLYVFFIDYTSFKLVLLTFSDVPSMSSFYCATTLSITTCSV